MKKKLVLGLAVMALTVINIGTVFAASNWKQDGAKWKYEIFNGYYLSQDNIQSSNYKLYEIFNGYYLSNQWKKIGNTWYHFDNNGYMQTGWIQDGGKWYYLRSDGAMHIGWWQEHEKWYYLGNDGVMQTGVVQENGTWYYLESDGVFSSILKGLGTAKVIDTPTLRLRKAPDVEAPTLAFIAEGCEYLALEETDNGFIKLQVSNDLVGYSMSEFLQIIK